MLRPWHFLLWGSEVCCSKLATRNLILVRHSLPKIIPDLPACQWTLSSEGQGRCTQLAERLAPWSPTRIVTSCETKAIETGEIVAGLLALPAEKAAGLHEHRRQNEPFTSQARFVEQVQHFFARPGQLVFGEETAQQAERRFREAVWAVLGRYAEDTVAIVAHGTVMSLLVAYANDMDPFAFWRGLRLPAFVVLTCPDLELLHIENKI